MKNLTTKKKIIFSIVIAVILLLLIIVVKNIKLSPKNLSNINQANVSDSVLITPVDFKKDAVNIIDENNNGQLVSSVKISDLRNKGIIVSLQGTVESSLQVDIKSQTNGQIAKKYVSIGDTVKAGQTLAVLNNSDILAQLSQAQASLKSAEIKLEKIQNATSGSGDNNSDLGTTINNAKSGVSDKIIDAYIKTDSALSVYVDQLFSSSKTSPNFGFNVTTGGTNIFVTAPPYDLDYINSSRQKINSLMADWNRLDNNIKSGNNFDEALAISEQTMQEVQNLLTRISIVLGNYNSTDASAIVFYNTYRGNIASARAAIDLSLSTLRGAEQVYASSKAVASPYEIKTQQVAVESANAQVQLIRAQLAKTIITSPINGLISYFSLRSGELVTVGQQIVSIVNPSGLQVKSYLSQEDFKLIEKGDKATVDGEDGFVNKIAPSIDLATKKVEISVVINDPKKSKLVIGQSSEVSIFSKGDNKTIFVPLDAVKVTSSASLVYIIGSDFTVTEKQVELGGIHGDYAEIKSGLQDEDKIIFPASSVKAGQKVEIKP